MSATDPTTAAPADRRPVQPLSQPGDETIVRTVDGWRQIWRQYGWIDHQGRMYDLCERAPSEYRVASFSPLWVLVDNEPIPEPDPTTAAPATPGQALRWARDRLATPPADVELSVLRMLGEWADELDASKHPTPGPDSAATPGQLDLDASELAEAANEWDGLQQALATATARVVELEAELEHLRPAACSMTHTPPYDFAQCETHDETFPLGAKCRFDGREVWEVFAEEADQQRQRAVRAEMDLEQLRAPGVYQLPAEPPEHVTALWEERTGCPWVRDRPDPTRWTRADTDDPIWRSWPWLAILSDRGPLSATPPAETEAPDAD